MVNVEICRRGWRKWSWLFSCLTSTTRTKSGPGLHFRQERLALTGTLSLSGKTTWPCRRRTAPVFYILPLFYRRRFSGRLSTVTKTRDPMWSFSEKLSFSFVKPRLSRGRATQVTTFKRNCSFLSRKIKKWKLPILSLSHLTSFSNIF